MTYFEKTYYPEDKIQFMNLINLRCLIESTPRYGTFIHSTHNASSLTSKLIHIVHNSILLQLRHYAASATGQAFCYTETYINRSN